MTTKQPQNYERTLSDDEIREERIMVSKEALKFFPKPFHKFNLRIGDQSVEAAVVSISCKCRGPEKPHEHYWLPVPHGGLRRERATRATIVKNDDQSYSLTLQ